MTTKLRTNRQQTGDPQTDELWQRIRDLNAAVTELQQVIAGVSSLTVKRVAVDRVIKVTTATDVSDLDQVVIAGQIYRFSFGCAVRSNDSIHNIAAGLAFPKATRIAATLRLVPLVAGQPGEWAGAILTSGVLLTPAGPAGLSTDFHMAIEGIIVPQATGALQLVAACQNAADNVTVRAGSCSFLWNLGAL